MKVERFLVVLRFSACPFAALRSDCPTVLVDSNKGDHFCGALVDNSIFLPGRFLSVNKMWFRVENFLELCAVASIYILIIVRYIVYFAHLFRVYCNSRLRNAIVSPPPCSHFLCREFRFVVNYQNIILTRFLKIF